MNFFIGDTSPLVLQKPEFLLLKAIPKNGESETGSDGGALDQG
jgi:hypothetical protein